MLSQPPQARFKPEQWLRRLEKTGKLPLEELWRYVCEKLPALAIGAVSPAFLEAGKGALINWVRKSSDWSVALRSLASQNTGEVGRQFLAWLDRGVHFGWIKPAKLIALEPTILDQFPCPLGYYRDLWLIGTTEEEAGPLLAQQHMVVPANFLELQKQAASRVCDFHQHHHLPWPTDLIAWPTGQPTWRNGILKIQTPDHTTHLLAKVARNGSEQKTPTQFLCELGLQGELCLRPLDPKLKVCYRPYPDGGWEVYRRNSEQEAFQFCCRPGHIRLQAPCWSAKRLDHALNPNGGTGIKELLARYGDDNQPNIGSPLWPNKDVSDQRLRDDPVCGSLYRYGPFSAPDLVVQLWLLAWVDRLTVHRGEKFVFQDLFHSKERLPFLKSLADALLRWPTLMLRLLALVELICRCTFDLGFGVILEPCLPPLTDWPNQTNHH